MKPKNQVIIVTIIGIVIGWIIIWSCPAKITREEMNQSLMIIYIIITILVDLILKPKKHRF